MFNEIALPTDALSLKQMLVQNVMTEAGQKIKIIDENAGLIAEAETLAERLKVGIITNAPHAVVNVQTDRILPRVMICFEMLSTVRAAVAAAGLHIFAEDRTPRSRRPIWELTDQVRLTLVGFDVEIIVDQIADELIIDQAAA